MLTDRRDAKAMEVFKKVVQLNLRVENFEQINEIVTQNFIGKGNSDADAIALLENALKTEMTKPD